MSVDPTDDPRLIAYDIGWSDGFNGDLARVADPDRPDETAAYEHGYRVGKQERHRGDPLGTFCVTCDTAHLGPCPATERLRRIRSGELDEWIGRIAATMPVGGVWYQAHHNPQPSDVVSSGPPSIRPIRWWHRFWEALARWVTR